MNDQKFSDAVLASFEAGDAGAAERLQRGAILSQIEQFPESFANGEKEKRMDDAFRHVSVQLPLRRHGGRVSG
jgi:hypothetical protein